jgi:hypothetical protein
VRVVEEGDELEGEFASAGCAGNRAGPTSFAYGGSTTWNTPASAGHDEMRLVR